MKLVEYTDLDGFKHLSWIKDNESDDKAKEGISCDPPDLSRIDWEQVKREINNRMVDMRLTDWDKVVKHQNALGSIINSVIKKQLVFLFREGERKNE